MKISACLIVCNEEKNLTRCLQSLVPVVDEIVVIDSGSIDRTLEIARSFKARVVHQDWLGYVGQKNFALTQAQHPWVLSIDADEELSPETGRRHHAPEPRSGGRRTGLAQRLPRLAAGLLSQKMDSPRRLVSRPARPSLLP